MKNAAAILKTKDVAPKFGLTPYQLRRVLRSMPRYADGVHTNYAWKGWSDPAIKEIEKAVKATAEKAKLAAAAAQAALKAAQKEEKAPKVTKKATKKATTKPAAPVTEDHKETTTEPSTDNAQA